ncbi:undecaprenyl-diphosphate phosphatase [Candidatus Gracilibacteria bacterium]|nr:undecaprenyl-diphosphate phosphatase [Candidatus Gracilibacteria bacterium]NJM86474.1 undecaprenyl-diphosphate phosphatase [Hydrococcus sp. RU_2_2]NJP17968.1 undecaprenyl-diphosphate phosphatase [Hydrococcus sp. CRU_1_1]
MTRITSKWVNFCSAVVLGIGLSLTLNRLAASQTSPDAATSDPMSHLNVFQAIVLGFVQGVTEFLPISSTAHLKVVPVLLGWGDPGVSFTAIIQLGSIASVLWYFWADLTQVTTGAIKAIQKSDYKAYEFRMAVGIILGTIPIVICGCLLKVLVPDLDNSPLRSMTTIAIASIVMASLLALAERLGTHKRSLEDLQKRDGVLMGLAQSLSLIPGVSRSGSTLTAGLFMDIERSTAARFSFLLGIPVITLAGLVELKDVFDHQLTMSQLLPLGFGLISSAVFSYLAIAWLLQYLKTKDTWVFVWYRLAFGLFLLGGIALGKISPN